MGVATVSRFLTEGHDEFHEEKKEIIREGLASTPYQQMDDTGARVNRKNHSVHILCNELYTAYFTRSRKDRLTIIEILTQGEMLFILNEKALKLMQVMKLPSKSLQKIRSHLSEKKMNRAEIDAWLTLLFPDPKRHQTNRR